MCLADAGPGLRVYRCHRKSHLQIHSRGRHRCHLRHLHGRVTLSLVLVSRMAVQPHRFVQTAELRRTTSDYTYSYDRVWERASGHANSKLNEPADSYPGCTWYCSWISEEVGVSRSCRRLDAALHHLLNTVAALKHTRRSLHCRNDHLIPSMYREQFQVDRA